MLITDQRQKTNMIDFGNLEFGDVFQDEDGDICIKVENDYGPASAVVLSTGMVFSCKTDTPVVKLITELTIKGEV
jgi:hypothetical protein